MVRRSYLENILATRGLQAVFQPIVSIQTGAIAGYEGLIRGPADGPLHSPLHLFRAAREYNLTLEVETACCEALLERFSQLRLPGKLFLNVSPDAVEQAPFSSERLRNYLADLGLDADRVVLELTEHMHLASDYEALRNALESYRRIGFKMAIDDLGEGFSSLRRWSELRPEFIKIDMHFVQGVDRDRMKQQLVRALNDVARSAGVTVVAEGIETEEEWRFLNRCGVDFGQGYYIARPQANPATSLSAELAQCVAKAWSFKRPGASSVRPTAQGGATALKLLRSVAAVGPETSNNEVCDLFTEQSGLHTIPVVEEGRPVGVITRADLLNRFSRPYQRELYGTKPCSLFMDRAPLVAEKGTSLQELSHILVEADGQQLVSDFIITDEGMYLGIGTSLDLLRELTHMQIDAARYAHPLTQLPGSVPINRQIDHLLQSGAVFKACYADLDNFKPFNDVFGYQRGDDIIQLAGTLLCEVANPELDFVGHVGGDDFIVLFQSADWRERCERFLMEFESAIAAYFRGAGREAQGYYAKDRQGTMQYFPVPSVSLGVVEVKPSGFETHHQIAAAAAQAKSEAKKTLGNSLFVERRRMRRNEEGAEASAF